jgi:hypothetical protein
MCELSELRFGQTAEWDDIRFGSRMTGTVEYVSSSTGWVTVKLKGASPPGPPHSDMSGGLVTDRVTHTTLRAAQLTPRD